MVSSKNLASLSPQFTSWRNTITRVTDFHFIRIELIQYLNWQTHSHIIIILSNSYDFHTVKGTEINRRYLHIVRYTMQFSYELLYVSVEVETISPT